MDAARSFALYTSNEVRGGGTLSKSSPFGVVGESQTVSRLVVNFVLDYETQSAYASESMLKICGSLKEPANSKTCAVVYKLITASSSPTRCMR